METPQIIWVDKAINRCNRLDFLPAEACVFLSLPVGKEGIPSGVKNSYLLGNRVDKQTKLGFVLPDSLLRKVRFRSIDDCPGELQIIVPDTQRPHQNANVLNAAFREEQTKLEIDNAAAVRRLFHYLKRQMPIFGMNPFHDPVER